MLPAKRRWRHCSHHLLSVSARAETMVTWLSLRLLYMNAPRKLWCPHVKRRLV